MPVTEEAYVLCREERIQLLTYRAMSPDPNPMFFEKRIYQGS